MGRGLFVEPFFGGSHRAFAEGLVAHGGHDLELLTLPGREWRRRMRLGAQVLAGKAAEVEGSFDFLLVSDMLDLPAFLALTRPRFERVPVLLFMHENQLTYPRLRGTKLNSWFGQINYLSALAADRVAFNSEYHRQDFLGALEELERQPNNWLTTDGLEAIRGKSTVLPVGVDLGSLGEGAPAGAGGSPLILWNHRWEFDKAPDAFVRTVTALAEERLDFRVAVAGERGGNPSEAMQELPERLGERLVQFGPVAGRDGYARLLWEADISISSTRHEFFGISTMEAMWCGCLPIAPRRYNYPALVPESLQGRCLYEKESELLALTREAIRSGAEEGEREALRGSAGRFGWEVVGPVWEAALGELSGGA
ncbi:MAG: DUF3524 domain-containing protein [Chloroflexi bacterium]|nr:DUF3524 domain-containing protein [Chloroflexota bacterium]